MEGRWSDAQIELFYALGKVCEKVGKEGAKDLLREGSNGRGLNTLDGRSFVKEITELKERAASIDGLEKVNVQLRAELDAAREKLLNAESAKSTSEAEGGEGGASNRSMGTQTSSNIADRRDIDWNGAHERLLQKHNVLTGSYQELVLARDQLESKLRSTQKSNREWVGYANNLEKKILRLQGKLRSHGTASKLYSEENSFENIPPTLLSSSREPVPARTMEGSLETLRRELPNLLHMSERISELARNVAVETPGYETPYLPQRTSTDSSSTDSSERQQGDSDANDPPLPVFRNPLRLGIGLVASDRALSTIVPKLLVNAATTQHHDPPHHVSSESHHSGSTDDDVNVLRKLPNREQIDTPPPIIKAEPLSDSPVVISSRSVKKRLSRNGTGSNESTSYTKVKVEIVTSSPIGLAGFQGLFPQESLDLDEIGEKMNTPKKRRRAIRNAKFGDNNIAYSQSPAEQNQADVLQQVESDFQPKGNPSALQPASPNKLILPRTSRPERESKRRRLEDRVRGAVIFGEDGENDVTSKIGADSEIQTGKIRKLSANAAKLQQCLSGLLDAPAPEKEILTPPMPALLSAATAQLRARAAPLNTNGRATPSNRRQISGGTTPNTFPNPGDTPRSNYQPSTGKKRTFRASKDMGPFKAENWDNEPLRARPVSGLGLEHFKINPHFNRGSDYAFTDVVRGRELRKCLPGCTKPGCCGDKFRKFVEFAREHEEQTLSQEEQDARLLEEYLGGNRSKLQNMTDGEKEELLIQARTRDLANKASKHRHAYERRRSPPGFWRSDFPSTQELQTDRHEAAIHERELVQQRYQEAMRPGGRWLFRDE